MSSVSQSESVQVQLSSETSAVPSSNVASGPTCSWTPRERVPSQEEIDLNQKLSDACHKVIYDFLPWSEIPRTAGFVVLNGFVQTIFK